LRDPTFPFISLDNFTYFARESRLARTVKVPGINRCIFPAQLSEKYLFRCIPTDAYKTRLWKWRRTDCTTTKEKWASWTNERVYGFTTGTIR